MHEHACIRVEAPNSKTSTGQFELNTVIITAQCTIFDTWIAHNTCTCIQCQCEFEWKVTARISRNSVSKSWCLVSWSVSSKFIPFFICEMLEALWQGIISNWHFSERALFVFMLIVVDIGKVNASKHKPISTSMSFLQLQQDSTFAGFYWIPSIIFQTMRNYRIFEGNIIQDTKNPVSYEIGGPRSFVRLVGDRGVL